MKKLLILFMIAAVFVSCKKNDTQPAQQVTAEVSFNVNQIIPEANRDDFPFGLPECTDLDAVYAHIVIKDLPSDDANAVIIYEGDVDLFSIPGDDGWYTQAIKLDLTGCVPGQQCCNIFYVTQFMVYAPDADGDGFDELVYAAPAAGSDAQGWLDYPDRMLDRMFEICEFKKYEFDIDVVCYEDAWYEYFGFFWFYVHEAEIREVCFFGDVCLKSPDDYAQSHYANQSTWPSIDVPAIMEITVLKWVGDGAPEIDPNGYWEEHGDSPYTNDNQASGWGVGAPLCVPYTDYLDKEDWYKAILKVMLKQGDQFPFIYMDEWVWNDDFETSELTMGIAGLDNIVDFVIGNCIVNGADFVYPPWMNLPISVTMDIGGSGYPGAGDLPLMYTTLTNPNPPGTYDVPMGIPLDAYCGDLDGEIELLTYPQTLVFSSLQPVSIMPYRDHIDDLTLQQLNYLANHFDENGIDVYNLQPASSRDAYPGDGVTIQRSIWYTAHEGGYMPPDGSLASTMANDALVHGAGYSPLPGGWAYVMCYAPLPPEPGRDLIYEVQLILILVDP